MLFNSLNFSIFLPIVFLIYWLGTKRNLKFQNILLLISSYFFYSCWDWRFLFLLIFSTLLDYYTGIKMSESKNQKVKKNWFWISVSINLGFLGIFKYYNFFAESFASAFNEIGLNVTPWSLKVVLPVGISFYTFHGLSYVIDIYKNRIKAERNFIDYAVFVSFFPLLVAGPIERANHLLPQIQKERTFDYTKAVDGLRQILWGLFKKIVISDYCAIYVNQTFDNYDAHNGSTLILGAILFAFQIYGDFSGYSDIALGTARLFGIDLLRNFAFPYFSRDIAEFWRRWHISLTTWFRDYVYIPLGGSKEGKWSSIRNTIIIFLVSGFWHGANWTFLAWGVFHALLFLPLLILNKNRENTNTVAENNIFPTLKELWKMCLTFSLVCFGWIFFRSENIFIAFDYIWHIFKNGIFVIPNLLNRDYYLPLFFSLFILLTTEWIQRKKKHGLEIDKINSHALKFSIYIFLISIIFWFGGKSETFIYFQF